MADTAVTTSDDRPSDGSYGEDDDDNEWYGGVGKVHVDGGYYPQERQCHQIAETCSYRWGNIV